MSLVGETCSEWDKNYELHFREDTKVSHYIINRISGGNQQFVYRIGDQNFQDLPELLGFYKLHYLDTTPLRRPAKKVFERVVCKFDFKAGVSKVVIDYLPSLSHSITLHSVTLGF